MIFVDKDYVLVGNPWCMPSASSGQDAFKRIERLEELRAKIREERHWMQGPPAPAAWLKPTTVLFHLHRNI